MDIQNKNIPPDKAILLFDGVCNLCNSWVQFVLKRNKSRSIVFGSLQSDSGQDLLKACNLPCEGFDSVVVIYEGKFYTKSNAIFIIVKLLDSPWPILGIFKIFPRFFRDKIYTWIANSRYSIFGKRDQCMIPDDDIKDRFLP